MSRLVIFKASWDELEKADVRPEFPDGGSSNILAQTLDFSEGGLPRVGDRIREHRDNGYLEASSTRLSPWQVTRVEVYAANTGLEEFGEVVLAHCEYLPLHEKENPWKESALGRITAENFGGDVEAFEEWKRTQQTAIAQ